MRSSSDRSAAAIAAAPCMEFTLVARMQAVCGCARVSAQFW
ncbi:hypothetical protein [Lysobacter gummosus]